MIRLRTLNAFRNTKWEERLGGTDNRDTAGCFKIPYNSHFLACLVGTGEGWDHISVHVEGQPRTPSWLEMDYIKRMFFKPDEVAFQLHVPAAQHINLHDYVLHLWRPQDALIPLPPSWMV